MSPSPYPPRARRALRATASPLVDWVTEVRTWRDDRAVAEITEARDRKLTLKLDGPSEYRFTISGYAREAFELQELIYDVVLYRGGTSVFRGRLGSSEDHVEPESHDLPFAAIDYRGLLDRRHFLEPRRYDQWDQADMAWDFVAYTQGQVGGELGITRGPRGEGNQPLRDRSYDPGKVIGEALGQLGRVVDGFNWDVTPDRVFMVFYPQRGIDTGAVLEYGSQVRRLRRAYIANDYANAVIGTGAEGTEPIVLMANDLAELAQGRIEGKFSDEDISVADTLYRYTLGALQAGSDPIGGYQIELAPGAYDARSMVLGNAYELRVRSGRLDFKRTLRIQEIEIAIGDDGEETVSLTMGKPPLSSEEVARRTDTRLNALERTAATRTFQLANVTSPRALVVTAEVDIGQLPDGGYGIRDDGDLVALRGTTNRWGQRIAVFYNFYPPDPQPGDVVLIPR